ncbi:MAG: transcriptional regulator PpsR [Sandaracinaceae bacterium]
MLGLHGITGNAASRIVASSADLVLVLDRDGTIVDLSLGEDMGEPGAWDRLVGQRWVDTVLRDSQRKVERLVRQAFSDDAAPQSREINQNVEGVGEWPFRFRSTLVDDDHVIALGHDLRPLAELQQRMVSAQQSMDLEYRRLRQADTRYRLLFRVTSEAALVVRGSDRSVIESNPAASRLLGETPEAIQGRTFDDLITPESRDRLLRLLGAAEAGAENDVLLEIPDGELELTASASSFRQSRAVFYLVRLRPAGAPRAPSERSKRLLTMIELLPDGFVVTGDDLRILNANGAFCELVEKVDESHVVGRRLDNWLGRPGVDLNIIVANLREHGVVRDFATIVRSDLDAEQEAVVTAVSALEGKVPCFGFTVRAVSSRIADAPSTTFLPRSVERLRGLVGRVSLKDIVKESTDLIEKLCIEAALDVSRNNRAAAAQLLGLSRQSLYSKLRRHGLGEFQPS